MRALTPNRLVALAAALCGLAGAIAVPVANLDLSSTIGVLGGLGTIAAAATKWLEGWQKHEARLADFGYDPLDLPVSASGPDPELVGDAEEDPAVADIPATDPAKLPADVGDARAKRRSA